MKKVGFFDRKVAKIFFGYTSAISTVFSLFLIFIEIPNSYKILLGVVFLLFLFVLYIGVWVQSNNIKEVELDIEGSKVTVMTGDIFKQSGFKVIAFNEYFDTQVDDKVISTASLNGIFVSEYLGCPPEVLDGHIAGYGFEDGEVVGKNDERTSGKKVKYDIGTICVYKDYLLTAFSRFDEKNRAYLTMPDYLGFLIKFWDQVNKVYAQRSVSVPIFGSGITRIKEHRNISDEDLLKIMLWTFRISEMRFKYPAKLTIVIHKDKIDQINLLEIKSARNGL
ncbi:hypothetical protein DFS28_10781 [Pseudomonas sp. 478]|uniref:macro domain-containing protein n=1 Tax=unclassified Pseudomonas TaxID=196821 RepID=UPI000DAF2433|nr:MULTISPECIES: macro domain-containing protein [unclassified Pseudomonas]PZW95271.1 hypothetical protein DFS28_10781 [Pseudomonas sp. 478]TCV50868.1 hypothetical protein EDB99_10882 [Pseudomonas sp. 460]